jgi:hypothetical protein
MHHDSFEALHAHVPRDLPQARALRKLNCIDDAIYILRT